jgi:Tol biopolymer transport system component/predicted Ser/Thr protein kinase
MTAGARLGAYEVVAPLGKGGMGEVWRARDPRLGREVAIKVSAQQFTDRFEREARAIAALNHPSICTLYDVGPNYLVMELVEGPTLAERIAQGPIPVEEALAIAKQIADALEAAHDKGIVHRDLKPANVKVRPDGSVKVLDFGLAKSGVENETTSDSPTMLSVAGMILGTAGYMAPEQARGKNVDKRADIWAFGVVLYEMVTGGQLFEGETVSDTLAAVLTREPDWSRVPPKLQRLLRTCLEKDPRLRLRDIGDWRGFLDAAVIAPAASAARASGVPRSLPWAIAAVFIIAAAVLGVIVRAHLAEEPQTMRVSVLTPQSSVVSNGSLPAISPDGRHIAFADRVGGKQAIWLRDLDALIARQLPGTVGAYGPFWSPDSRWIAFFMEGKLQKIAIGGGPPQTVCEIPQLGRSGSWNRDGVLIYALTGGGLMRVPAAGGVPSQLTSLDSAAGEVQDRTAWFLPDGRHFIYTSRNEDPVKSRIYADSIDAKPGSNTRREIVVANSNAVWVPRTGGVSGAVIDNDGFLLYMRESTLVAQPFDAAALKTTGDPVPVAEDVYFNPTTAQGQFSASQDGSLVYASGGDANQSQLTWIDRTGKPVNTAGERGNLGPPRLSPEGSRVAYVRFDAGSADIWLRDLGRDADSRFTFGPSNRFPVWSPDGNSVAWIAQRGGKYLAYQKSSSGVGIEQVLDQDGTALQLEDWSNDGRWLLEERTGPKTRGDIWVFPTSGDKKPFPYIDTGANETSPRFSPDSRFVAYLSNESRDNEVYVETFPARGGKWQISSGGGGGAFSPVWSRDGHELYFISLSRSEMMAVEVRSEGAKFQAGVARPLFPVSRTSPFDVSKDGRFLMLVTEARSADAPLTLVTNWQAGLKK